MLRAAYRGQLKNVRAALKDGADVDIMPDDIGLSALHMAIGRNHLDIVQHLIEKAGATIQPDSFGRWPTIIAAQCKASDKICDYMVEREAELEGIGNAIIDE
ncbi:MAG: ankyrin repeat domain-containing protein [bacterium]|nr:ankyrin repeat domain-containing protein [bacterium]